MSSRNRRLPADIKSKLWLTKGNRVGGEIGNLGIADTHTTMYKIDKYQGPTE